VISGKASLFTFRISKEKGEVQKISRAVPLCYTMRDMLHILFLVDKLPL
jgi:hypothetical protein